MLGVKQLKLSRIYTRDFKSTQNVTGILWVFFKWLKEFLKLDGKILFCQSITVEKELKINVKFNIILCLSSSKSIKISWGKLLTRSQDCRTVNNTFFTFPGAMDPIHIFFHDVGRRGGGCIPTDNFVSKILAKRKFFLVYERCRNLSHKTSLKATLLPGWYYGIILTFLYDFVFDQNQLKLKHLAWFSFSEDK